ncbi:MAG TPA: hypothetical protein VH834_20405 [Solirubrobacteraceae bacterium]
MDERVCPFCGEPPGAGVFCAACGRNLSSVEQLPTRADWEQTRPVEAATVTDDRPLDERCAAATEEFLAKMHAASDPGTTKIPITGASGVFRVPSVHGWVVRAVHRDVGEDPDAEIADLRRYEPGLLLTPEGAFHRIDSDVRGWGQRDFPRFYDSVDREPIEMPVEARLIDELAAVLRRVL